MPWYIADYLADTAHLRAAQSGAYLHLIMHYWQRGGLPSENVQLSAIARMTDAEWKKARPIIEPFFQMPGWKHKRVEEELAKSQSKYEARAAAGKSGGEAKAKSKQNPSNATANEQAGLNQPQPQPLSKPESSEKKGESSSPSKGLKVVSEGEDEPILIGETYQPSERAVEYAYSLGMKKADLDAEHRKFVTMSVAARAKSYNPDMSFKLFCDRWLEFKRKNNPDWQPAPDIVRVPPEPFVLVIQGTTEAAAWNQYNRDRGLRPLFFCKQVVDGVEIIAARCPSLVPPGYDEATGEKLAPTNAEDAA
ncbi:MAG: hypothetical protein JWL86_802 [Rhizobium sp.]|nr:hypothetical protein [Rhizobium sp.]